jgi:hypothetical protein
MADRYEFGSIVTLKGEFRTPKSAVPSNTLIDPTTVTLRIQQPDKTVVTRTYGVSGIDKVDVGIYTSKLTLNQEGTYYWRWTGSNGADATGVVSGLFDSRQEPNF